jgi:hypothetical protein
MLSPYSIVALGYLYLGIVFSHHNCSLIIIDQARIHCFIIALMHLLIQVTEIIKPMQLISIIQHIKCRAKLDAVSAIKPGAKRRVSGATDTEPHGVKIGSSDLI